MRAPARAFRLFNLRHRGIVDVWGPHLPVPESGLSASRSFNIVGDVLRFRAEFWIYQDRMVQSTNPQYTWMRQNAEDPDIQLRSKLHIQFSNAFNDEPVEAPLSYESRPAFGDLGRHPTGYRPDVPGMGICGVKLVADVVSHPDARTAARTLTVNLLVDKDLFARRPYTQYPPLYCHLRLIRMESWGICDAAAVPGPVIEPIEAMPNQRAVSKANPAAKAKAPANGKVVAAPKAATKKKAAAKARRR
jgi:hypothetical protein